MPIPPLNAEGLLPVGIHDATLDELRQRFGAFHVNDQRPKLFAKRVDLARVMQVSALFDEMLIDGSFIAAERASAVYKRHVDFFSGVREAPNLKKGLVRLML